MASDRAHALRAESERLLSGVAPAHEPPPQAAPRRTLLPGEHRLTAEDWAVIDSEPDHRREMTRRAIVQDREREAARAAPLAKHAPRPNIDRTAEAAANRVVVRFLDNFMPRLGDRLRSLLAVRDDRIAELERRVAALEAESRGGGA